MQTVAKSVFNAKIEELANTIFTGHQETVRQLRARLMSDLQARGKEWVRDRRSGRKLDGGRLVRAGYKDPRIFKNKVRREKLNTAVCLLGGLLWVYV